MLTTRPLPRDTCLRALRAASPDRFPLLLETAAQGGAQGRWDLLLARADDGDVLELGRDGRLRDGAGGDAAIDGDHDFLRALDARWRDAHLPREEPRWPFRGGWALFLGYELAAQVEPVLSLPPADGTLPVALALRCPAAVLRDHATGDVVAVAEAGEDTLLEVVAALATSARVDDGSTSAVTAAHGPAPGDATRDRAGWTPPAHLEEDDPGTFLDGVRRVQDYLAAGDLFQANLSRGWVARFEAPPTADALYARMRAANPAPFAGLFAHGGRAVSSASPERLVSVRGDVVETRPIAGTRPRIAGDDDAATIRALVGHPKERAEHVMLVDLERNDLGRVCVAGSVEVDELMAVESYAHVHHIVSNVRGRLRADATPGAVLRAVFPGGTITGCPKVRCMQVIAELEGTGRGAYTGAFGWLGRDGDMDLNILIRSAALEGDTLRFRTGAGIVVDSDPARELDETRAKARGMLRALGVAG